MVLQGCSGLWMLLAAPLQGITPAPSPLCLLQMRSPIPGLGRVMVFLAAALASASLAIPEGWGEEGEPPRAPRAAPVSQAWGSRRHPIPPGRHRPTRIGVYTKRSPVAMGVLWAPPPCSPIAQPQLGPVLPSPPWWYLHEARPHSQRPAPEGDTAAGMGLGGVLTPIWGCVSVPPGVQYGQVGTDVTLSCAGARTG